MTENKIIVNKIIYSNTKKSWENYLTILNNIETLIEKYKQYKYVNIIPSYYAYPIKKILVFPNMGLKVEFSPEVAVTTRIKLLEKLDKEIENIINKYPTFYFNYKLILNEFCKDEHLPLDDTCIYYSRGELIVEFGGEDNQVKIKPETEDYFYLIDQNKKEV